MNNEQKIAMFQVAMGIEAMKRKAKRAGFLAAAEAAQHGTDEQKLAMFEKLAKLY